MNAGEEWIERRRRGTTTAPQQSQPLHSVDADACSTLRGLARLSADLCRALGGVSARPSAVADPYDHGLVGKMLTCGNPTKIGDMAYRCLHGGQGQHVVAIRCTSSLCVCCATVAVDNWVSQVSRVLHAGVISRPIILTVPAMFRTTFDQNAAVMLRAFSHSNKLKLNTPSSLQTGLHHPPMPPTRSGMCVGIRWHLDSTTMTGDRTGRRACFSDDAEPTRAACGRRSTGGERREASADTTEAIGERIVTGNSLWHRRPSSPLRGAYARTTSRLNKRRRRTDEEETHA
jgi:hypothetical protein